MRESQQEAINNIEKLKQQERKILEEFTLINNQLRKDDEEDREANRKALRFVFEVSKLSSFFVFLCYASARLSKVLPLKEEK